MTKSLTQAKIVEILQNNDDFYILMHKRPDGDTIGSSFALYYALRSLGKRAKVLCSDEIPVKFNFITNEYIEEDFDAGFVVSVDVANPELLGEKLQVYANKTDLCIDHHASNRFYANCTFTNPSAAATGEVIFEVIKELGATITSLIADCLYTSLITDTGSFRYVNTTAYTHRVAAYLLDCGARHTEISRKMFEEKSRQKICLEKLALSALEFFFEGKCAVICVTRNMLQTAGVKDSETDGISAIPTKIEGVIAGVTIREIGDGEFKLSLRCQAPMNASDFCAQFGGGGHPGAAGCTLKGKLKDVKQKFLSALEAYVV